MQTIGEFLNNNPHEIFVLTFEDYTRCEQLQAEFARWSGETESVSYHLG
ncbi:hypothetical protein ACFWAT_03730 [Streptomyces syringium]